MSADFLVFARPRSRTAWLANFLTYGDVFCLHDGIAEAGSLAAMARRFDQPHRFGASVELLSPGPSVLGLADTGLLHLVDEALAIFPRARLVFVTSDGRTWHRFASAHRMPGALVAFVDTAYSRAVSLLGDRALFVDAHELDQVAKLRRVWEHVGARSPFPRARLEMLRGLNVQVDPELLAERIRRTLRPDDAARR